MAERIQSGPAYPLRSFLRDLWPFIRPYRGHFFLGTFFSITSQIVWLYPPYALASIVSFFASYTSGDSLQPLITIAILWSIASVYHYVGNQVAWYFGYKAAERASLDGMTVTLEHMLRLDLRWHERENSGNKLKRIQKGFEGINRIVRMWFNNVTESIVNFVGMIFIIARFDYGIAAAVLVFLVTYFLLSFPLTRRSGNASHASNQVEEDVNGLIFEILNNIRSVKVLGMGTGLLAVTAEKMDGWYGSILRRVNAFRVREATLNMWGQIFRLGITFYIIAGIVRGRYEIGFLILFYTYFNYIWESIGKISSVTVDYVISKYSFLRMKEILEQPVGIDREDGKRDFPADWKTITLKNLSFSYGSKVALDNVSFTIRRGQRIGIVGLSGAGKSTLFKLLLKEHEHYTGEILIDDVPLRDIRRSSFFDYTAVVLQDTEVFNFTLRDNIALARPDAKDRVDVMQRAVDVSHISDFLSRMPLGLETIIGEKGIKLSGGEKQRLGIARAIFKEPQLLFLDEATSHLDLESEEKIRDSLHQFFQSVTAIVIAHRLTTIREMDNIIVIEGGRILEQGTFDELQEKNGRFAQLWKKQRF